MRLCRYGDNQLGVIDNEEIIDVSPALSDLPHTAYPAPPQDALIANLESLTPRIELLAASGRRTKVTDAKLLSPLGAPGKLVAAPVNYRKHLQEVRDQSELNHNNQAHMREIREIGLFLKANSSLIGASDAIELRFPDRRNDHEIELAVVIGRTANGVSAASALDHVAGYCIGLDMTLRGSEDRSFRKSIDTYSVLGPWLVTADEFGNPTNVGFELIVDGEVRQSANTRDLILSVPELIEYASSFYTLYPGDVIFTGTPEGVGEVTAGNTITAKMDRIGEINVSVRRAAHV